MPVLHTLYEDDTIVVIVTTIQFSKGENNVRLINDPHDNDDIIKHADDDADCVYDDRNDDKDNNDDDDDDSDGNIVCEVTMMMKQEVQINWY